MRIRVLGHTATSSRTILVASLFLLVPCAAHTQEAIDYVVVDTGQVQCFDDAVASTCPNPGQAFYGQDAQHDGNQPSYTLSGDGLSVYDNNTGLTWQRSPNTDGDGDIDADDKLTWGEAQAYPATRNSQDFGGYDDWRLPNIKELYSLIDFRGTDPSGYEGSDTTGLIPFIDADYFEFAYGDTGAGERIIDSQYASSTLYVATVAEELLFGVNFADGRIKGYGLTLMGSDKTFFVICVRGNTGYGQNDFADNGDGTISDSATGLMWTQADGGAGMIWEDALAWAETRNGANHLGYNDWRLPNAKELQSILDYARSPDTTSSAAIDPLFDATAFTNEASQKDYPYYWSATTHENWTATSGGAAAYVAFGRAMGYMDSTWRDVHGAGAQRSDPKDGDPADYPYGHGPQGDAIRIYNYVRLVRDIAGGEGEGEGEGEVQPYMTGAGWKEDGERLALAVEFPGAVGATTYQWFRDDATILGETSHVYQVDSLTADDSGWYSCEVTDEAKALYEVGPVFVAVFPAGSLPAAGAAALCVLAGLLTLAGVSTRLHGRPSVQ